MLKRSIFLCVFVPLMNSRALAKAEPLEFRGWLQWLNTLEHTTPDTKNELNPENQVLRIPNTTYASLLRPNFKITSSDVQFVVRPRVIYRQDYTKVNDKQQPETSQLQSYLNDAFVQWTVSDTVTFTYGKQVYQWGAAETFSPSNRIFHDVASNRDIRYEVRGKRIARLNLSSGKELNAVLMADVEDDKDALIFNADTKWVPSALAKGEYGWNSGADYLGLVMGGQKNGLPWIGEYFNVSVPFFDGLSLFGDTSHQRGSEAWYPVVNSQNTPVGVQQQITFGHSRLDSKHVYTLAVVGLKYDFINGTILRGEYVYNEAGYTKTQRDLARAALDPRNPLQQPVLLDNFKRYFAPGLDITGQRYAYASLYVPDMFKINDLLFMARTVYSLLDKSSLSYVSVDYKMGGNGTLSLAVGGGAGKSNSELKGFTAPMQYLAYRHDW
ncbi:MAG: hypothetical protein FJ146_04130 [Deltaproteobacteria bacterium]|nr:hypothetical protein [Deltaproteobacteria bacterium]